MRVRERARSIAQRGSDYFEMSGRTEFIVAALLLALLLAFKIVNITRYKFETDESQHLHVIWGWANGFVQYRDLCDNHMPLFQLVFAPVYKLIGDRATILYWMRFALLPMSFVAAWCTYRIGALCFSKRAGVWALLLTGFYPGYHFCSLEFRTDNLWAPLWLLGVVVLLSGAITIRRAAVAGLLLGLCFGISLKTTLLLISILVAGVLALFFVGRERFGLSRAHLVRCGAVFLACAIIIPAAIMAAFAMDGVWPQFRYWVLEHNIVPGLRNHPAWWVWIFPIAFPVLIYAGWRIVRATSQPAQAMRRGFVFFLCAFYIPALWSFWSLVTRQDYLPYHPLAFVLYAGTLLAFLNRFALRQLQRILLPAIVTVEFLIALFYQDAFGSSLIARRAFLYPFWVDTSQNETDLLRATLQLTEPGDFVLDEKGETVFRQRAVGPIWEPCVIERIRRGLMHDHAAERCVATRTCVAVLGKDIPAEAGRFISENYLYVGHRLRVVGESLDATPADAMRFDFTVVIPAAYEIIARAGAVTGRLDGEPYDGAHFLAAGRHSFVQTSNEIGLVALWAQAVDRHFTPFNYSNPRPDS